VAPRPLARGLLHCINADWPQTTFASNGSSQFITTDAMCCVSSLAVQEMAIETTEMSCSSSCHLPQNYRKSKMQLLGVEA